MIPHGALGLNAAGMRALRAAMRDTGGRIRTRVEALNLAGDPLADLTPYLLDGQRDIDATAEITRSAALTLHDPRRALPFDTDHPSATALYFDRMVRVVLEVLVDGAWQRIACFTGPVSHLNRDEAQVSIECVGKEALFLGAAWAPINLHKGMKKTDAIVRLLTEANPVYTETHLDIPDLDARLPHHMSLTREDKPWRVAQKIARSMSRQLFYDGRGVCRLRTRPQHVVLTFNGGHEVLSAPQIDESDTIVNAVAVVGAIPKGSKQHVRAHAVAPANHPLSPQRIGRYLLPDDAVIQDDAIKTNAEAQSRADQELADGLRQGVDVSFDAIPSVVALLDPDDLCHVATDAVSVTFRHQRSSLPFVAGEAATVGVHRKFNMRHAQRRGRHHAHRTHPPRKRRR